MYRLTLSFAAFHGHGARKKAALSGVDQDVDNRTPHRSFLGVASAC